VREAGDGGLGRKRESGRAAVPCVIRLCPFYSNVCTRGETARGQEGKGQGVPSYTLPYGAPSHTLPHCVNFSIIEVIRSFKKVEESNGSDWLGIISN
jgi:hypothetical protein